MTQPENLEVLSTLPSSVTTALANLATTTAKVESAESREAAEWSVIAGLQQSIIDRHEKEVLTERRLIWDETTSLLAATAPSAIGQWTNYGGEVMSSMRWNFAHPRLQQIGGLDAALSVGIA